MRCQRPAVWGGQASIEEVLRAKRVFVEELFAELLDALGFPAARNTSP